MTARALRLSWWADVSRRRRHLTWRAARRSVALHMSAPDDTIVALATPVGTAALAVVRVSGPDTPALATALAGALPPARTARHLDYRAQAGELLDDVLLTFFQGPQSYTGEHAAEISCHGNPFIAQKIVEDLLARGCRLAEPGEFTQRAFLNGKMDLSQAEAVMDVIHARSERALAAAHQLLRGGLSERMEPLVDGLLSVLAEVEAYIDFPDEDLPPEDRSAMGAKVDDIILRINDLAATSHYGSVLRDGLKTVIVGAPNAGKSSLLNRLVGSDRALVSPEPGTTRDFIEERISMGPHLLRLIDTAGLNSSPAPVEKLGIAKTHERVAEADLVLWVVDGSLPSPAPSPELAGVRAGHSLVVFNKSDVVSIEYRATPTLRGAGLWVSALTGDGIDDLRAAIVARADALAPGRLDLVTINARHARALDEARGLLRSAAEKLSANGPAELLASDLRGALSAFGAITGRIDNERMLDELFASFCIGK